MLRDDFMWGGALAAHQFEGGLHGTSKGLSVADVMTSGAADRPRRITEGVLEGEYYPNHEGVDFYHHYKAVSYTHLRSRSKSSAMRIAVRISSTR